jgi:Flp pilus assembly secretin CpaC
MPAGNQKKGLSMTYRIRTSVAARLVAAILALGSVATTLLSAAELKEITLKEGTSELVSIPGVTRFVNKDGTLLDCKIQNQGTGEILVSGNKFGTAEILCIHQDGKRTTIKVTVQPRFMAALLDLLAPYPQIDAKVQGEKVVLSGIVPKQQDLDRIKTAAALDERILVAVMVGNNGLAEAINKNLAASGYSGIEATTVGQTVFLKGEVFNPDHIKQIQGLANAQAAVFGYTVNADQMVYREANLLIKVQFVSLDKEDMKDVGISISPIGATASVGGAYSKERSDSWTGSMSGTLGIGATATLNHLIRNGNAKVAYESTTAAKSGKKAEFKAGGTIYREVATDDAVGTVPIEHGFIVSVLPQVQDKGNIEAHLEVELSVPTDVGGKDINMSEYRTASDYRFRPGETLALSGLNEVYQSAAKQGVAGLSKIPLFGKLFDKKESNLNSRNAVVLVTVSWADAGSNEAGKQAYERMKAADITPAK